MNDELREYRPAAVVASAVIAARWGQGSLAGSSGVAWGAMTVSK